MGDSYHHNRIESAVTLRRLPCRNTMALNLQWQEIALRLALTLVAGAVVGINRSEHGRPAGLRTTLLVCLAASVAMIQANLLLATSGKAPNSFVTLDLMRLPLGILSGMGFIGAGTILRRDNLIQGVTTAATLWFVTVVGLCFGGGQLILGATALVIGLVVLWGLNAVEEMLPQDRYSTLTLTLGRDRPTDEEVAETIRAAGLRVVVQGMYYDATTERRELKCEVRWKAKSGDARIPSIVKELSQLPGVSSLRWTPQGTPVGVG
jgi:putative Mg2+ transporter-C (MgtC) family protein